MNRSNAPSLAEFSKYLAYSPDTGRFTWVKQKGGHGIPGKIAGSLDRYGYRQIMFQKRLYLEHRLAWLFTYGEWPDQDLDHINRRKDDNRIANLRLVTVAENMANAGLRKDNKSGSKGVWFNKAKRKWETALGFDGVKRYLGAFATKEDAEAAYKKALHSFFVRIAEDHA